MFVTMKIRLSVASLAVAGLAYIFGPLPMIGIMVFVGGIVGYSSHCENTTTPSLYPPPSDEE
jgi:hypothetical protein